MTDETGAELREHAADTARQTRAVLADLDDPGSELTATAATRHRLEGAALALEGVSAGVTGAVATPSRGQSPVPGR